MLAKMIFQMRAAAAAAAAAAPDSASRKGTKKKTSASRRARDHKKRMAIAFDVFLRKKRTAGTLPVGSTGQGAPPLRSILDLADDGDDDDADEGFAKPRDEVVWKSDDRCLHMKADGTVYHVSRETGKQAPVLNAALEVINRSIHRDCSIETMSKKVFGEFPLYQYRRHDDTGILPLEDMLAGASGETRQLLVIQAMKGMGKSKCIRAGINSGMKAVGACPSMPTVLNLTFRRVLARGVSKELGPEAQSYLDFPPDEFFDSEKTRVLTILINSLHRTKGTWDVLIIDEVVSVMEMLGSRLIDPATQFRIVNRLIELVMGAKLVIVADAHNNVDTFVSVRELILSAAPPSEWDVRVHDYVHRNRAHHRYFSTRTLSDWKQILFTKLAAHQKVVIPCMTRRFALDLTEELRRRFPKLKVLCYVANPEEEIDMEGDMANVNTRWPAYDVVIYSPIIVAGVSFEMKYFHCCMMYAMPGFCTVSAAVQMLARVRSLVLEETIVFIDRVDDCFGGIISAPEEIIVREAWTAAVDSASNSKNLGERALGIIDMICAMTSKTDIVRKLRFESEFWKCVAWGGGVLRSYDVMSASPEARSFVVSHINQILDAAEICCVRPRIYTGSSACDDADDYDAGSGTPAGGGRSKSNRRRARRGEERMVSCGSGQLIKRFVEYAGECTEDTPQILRLIRPENAPAAGGGGGRMSTSHIALQVQEDRRLELAGVPNKKKKRTRRKGDQGDLDEIQESDDEPGEEERIASILSLQEIQSGSFFDQETGESTPCPSSLKLENVFKTVDDWNPLLGDILCRDPRINFHHLEQLGILEKPASESMSFSRLLLAGTTAEAAPPPFPRWVSQENAHLWQLASIRVLQKIVWERLASGAVPEVTPRAPPRCFSRCGIVSYTNSSPSPRGTNPEEVSQHDCIPAGIFERVPAPRDHMIKLWAKFLRVTSGDDPEDMEESGRAACTYAWKASAADLDCRSSDLPTNPQFDAMVKYCAHVAEAYFLPVLRLMISEANTAEAEAGGGDGGGGGGGAGMENVDGARWKLLIDPHVGEAASSPKHHHVHFALVPSHRSWRETRIINLNMFFSPSREFTAPQIAHAWSIPHLVVSAAAVARTYGYVISGCVHVIPQSGTCMHLPTPNLASMRIHQEFITRRFVTTPPLRAMFVLPSANGRAHGELWDVWWPEGGLKIKDASPKKMCRILRANGEMGVLSAARVVTWGGTGVIESCLRTILGGDSKAVENIVDQIHDLRMHAEFFSKYAATAVPEPDEPCDFSADAVRPLDIVESNRATRMVHHAAGSHPFPDTKASGPQPMPRDVPHRCAKLAQIFFGCMRSKNMAFIGSKGQILHIIPTNPFLKVGDVRCFQRLV
jgi:hypothetical protein